jgi:hypothetical protein
MPPARALDTAARAADQPQQSNTDVVMMEMAAANAHSTPFGSMPGMDPHRQCARQTESHREARPDDQQRTLLSSRLLGIGGEAGLRRALPGRRSRARALSLTLRRSGAAWQPVPPAPEALQSGPLMLMVTFALITYMNFKYGSSQSPDLGDSVPREVRDRDYFYLWSYSTWSVWAALGLAAVWRVLATRASEMDAVRWRNTAPVLLIGLIPLVSNWRDASRANETATREWARDLLNSIEPYGVLVTLGDNDTFPLWYAQQVEGVRPDVTVAVTSLLGTDWYPRGLLRRKIPRKKTTISLCFAPASL